MTVRDPYEVRLPGDAYWPESNMMTIPNPGLTKQLGTQKLGARLWRLPPLSPRRPGPSRAAVCC